MNRKPEKTLHSKDDIKKLGNVENIDKKENLENIGNLGTIYQQLVHHRQNHSPLQPTHPSGAQKSASDSPKEPILTAYTFGDITYQLPIALTYITKLYMVQTINDHVTIYLEGEAPDTLEAKDIERVGDKEPIELNLPGRETPFFSGVCTGISLKYQAGFRTIEIEGKSWTHELDIVKKSRSFQKLGIDYQELINEILKDYPKKAFINALPDNRNYNRFAVQYQETDWELLKRLAAREGTVLVAEYNSTEQRPAFWLGLPKFPTKSLTVTAEKNACRDHKKYLQVVSNHDESVKERDFFTYEAVSYEMFPLGETVDYAGKTLTITHIVTTIDKGLLQNTYTLAYSEKMALAHPEHPHLTGVSLSGAVLNSRGVNSKIHLQIDATQDEATAIWFPYANDTGNIFYCMPHNGESINLYFKDGYEENAIAVNGARKNGGGCKKTADYNNRYFTNHERKELFLSPDTVSFTVDESAADKITIKMTEQGGIDIESTEDICLNAENTISFEADEGILMESGKTMDSAGGSS